MLFENEKGGRSPVARSQKTINSGSKCCNFKVLWALTLLACGVLNVWYSSHLIRVEEDVSKPMHSTPHRHHMHPPEAGPPTFPSIPLTTSKLDNNYNFTIAICAIVKDMDAYLMEWLDYHLGAMYIENIYLYDHSDQFYLKHWQNNTRNHPLYRRVRVFHFNKGKTAQRQAYQDCIARFGKINDSPLGKATSNRKLDVTAGHDYLALIDGDEFLVPKGKYTSVHGVVNDYLHPYGGALTVNWMLMGSSNKTFYSPIPVTKRFQHTDERPHFLVKTIVKASDFSGIKSPHSVSLRQNLVRTTLYKGAIQNEQFKNVSKTGASDSKLPSSVMLVHHYKYMSAKEYDYKSCLRMAFSGWKNCDTYTKKAWTPDLLKVIGKPEHVASSVGTVFDDSAWKILCDRVPKYRIYDDEILWGDYTRSN